MRYPLRSSRFRALSKKYPKTRSLTDGDYQHMLLKSGQGGVWDREWLRIMALLRQRKIVRDNRLAVVDIDGLLQFLQLDTIPFFHCDGKIVEQYLRDWTG